MTRASASNERLQQMLVHVLVLASTNARLVQTRRKHTRWWLVRGGGMLLADSRPYPLSPPEKGPRPLQ
eukprot:4286486-Alexandrium_andersonii.AAC.1